MWQVAYNLKLDFRLRDGVQGERRGMAGTGRVSCWLRVSSRDGRAMGSASPPAGWQHRGEGRVTPLLRVSSRA